MIQKLTNSAAILLTSLIIVPIIINLNSQGFFTVLLTSMAIMFLTILCFVFIRQKIAKAVNIQIAEIKRKTVRNLATNISEDVIFKDILVTKVLNDTSTVGLELHAKYINYYKSL